MKIQTKKLNLMLAKIKQYNNIVVFRHESPDFDALGSQYGMIQWLKHNFKDKLIIQTGITNSPIGANLFPKSKSSKIILPFLAIVLDTANQGRISGEAFKDADYIIKIDHHPSNDNFGDLNIVYTEASSVGELLYYIFTSSALKKYSLDKLTARYLMIGLIGDTGRLVYPSTTLDTINAFAELTKKGIYLQDIYRRMYQRRIEEIPVIKRIYNNLVITKEGLGYFYFLDKDQKELKIHPDEVTKYLPYLSNFKEIKIFTSITEDKNKAMFRVSVRSNDIVINKVAQKFGGGGHIHAAGVKLKSLADTKKIIKALNQLL
jgi:bifunctional oligoribonuclease and PAP phosphatase NrnA